LVDREEADVVEASRSRRKHCVTNDIKSEMLKRLFEKFDNNAQKASTSLGIPVSTLKNWRKNADQIMIAGNKRKQMHKEPLKITLAKLSFQNWKKNFLKLSWSKNAGVSYEMTLGFSLKQNSSSTLSKK
jgi:hypothetical protein